MVLKYCMFDIVYVWRFATLIMYILRGFRELVIVFFPVKNTPKLINQQLKNGVKIVNWKKKVSYCFFYCQKYPCLKLKNEVKIVNWQK